MKKLWIVVVAALMAGCVGKTNNNSQPNPVEPVEPVEDNAVEEVVESVAEPLLSEPVDLTSVRFRV